VVFLMAFSYQGGNEEIGWRGTMQPILQKRFSFTMASVIVSVVWVCWHIPLWFIPGDTHQAVPFFGFAFLGIFLAVWLAAVYATTHSVLACMVIHGLSNTLMGVLSFQVGPAYFVGAAILTAFSIYVGTRAKTEDDLRTRRHAGGSR
jgi:membrane protease YdiL (CAAX protease family)